MSEDEIQSMPSPVIVVYTSHDEEGISRPIGQWIIAYDDISEAELKSRELLERLTQEAKHDGLHVSYEFSIYSLVKHHG